MVMKEFIRKYKHAWVFLYGLIYFPWFFWLEQRHVSGYHLIYASLDRKIPFCEYFIIPYLLWFAYVVGTLLLFLFTQSKEEFYKLTGNLFVGMSVCLGICTLRPNIQVLRPVVDPDQNIFCWLVSMIYRADTPTNVFPSIHVYASIGVHIALVRSTYGKKYPIFRLASGLLMLSIILSTMFLKQHSVLDVMAATILSSGMYSLIYRTEFGKEGYRVFRRRRKAAKA